MSEPSRGATRPDDAAPKNDSAAATPPWLRWTTKIALGAITVLAAGALTVAMLVAVALAVAYPNLPQLSGLTDYRPRLPMRIYSADKVLLGEFGEERRQFVPLPQIPKVMQIGRAHV